MGQVLVEETLCHRPGRARYGVASLKLLLAPRDSSNRLVRGGDQETAACPMFEVQQKVDVLIRLEPRMGCTNA